MTRKPHSEPQPWRMTRVGVAGTGQPGGSRASHAEPRGDCAVTGRVRVLVCVSLFGTEVEVAP